MQHVVGSRLRQYLLGIVMVWAMALGLWQVTAVPVYAETPKAIICENIPGQQCENTNKGFLGTMLNRVVKPLLFIAGAGAVVMIIVGGLRFVLSAGGQEGVQGAKRTVLYATIGLAVVILAYALVNYVINKLD